MANIWDLAIQRANEPPKTIGAGNVELDENARPSTAEQTKSDEGRKRGESYVMICGSKDCGKSTFVQRFLDRDEIPKPTIALEYTYGRRTRGNNKDVGHIWELGGGPFLSNLLEIPIAGRNLELWSMILFLDLSKPDELWWTTNMLLDAARRRVNKLLNEMKATDPNLQSKIMNDAWARVGVDHPDKDMLKPFPVPLAIVGAKYDMFQDLESEKRKAICKTLRFIAHTNGASLLFYSNKMENLVIRGRALMSHLVFDTSPSKGQSVDFTKPLFVPTGMDSLAEIGAPPLQDAALASVHVNNPNDLWKTALESHYPQKEMKMEVRDDPAKDPQYKEDAIDKLREQKDQELERYIRQKSDRKELAERDNRLRAHEAKMAPSPIQSPRSHTPAKRTAAEEDDDSDNKSGRSEKEEEPNLREEQLRRQQQQHQQQQQQLLLQQQQQQQQDDGNDDDHDEGEDGENDDDEMQLKDEQPKQQEQE